MKLLVQVLLFGQIYGEGDRFYANQPAFLNGSTANWNDRFADYNFKIFTEKTSEYFNKYFTGTANNVGNRLANLLSDVRQDLKSMRHRCDARRSSNVRNRRDGKSDKIDIARFTPIFSDDPVLDTEEIFFQYARWVREEIFYKCQNRGMRMVFL